MDVITLESKAFQELLKQIDEIKTQLIKSRQAVPLTDVWLDNNEVCALLKLSKRTLQTYRDEGKLSFSQVGAKIFYRSSDIEKFLEAHLIPSYSLKHN